MKISFEGKGLSRADAAAIAKRVKHLEDKEAIGYPPTIGRRTRQKYFNIIADKEIKEHRAGTEQDRMLELFLNGCSFPEAGKHLGWDYKQLFEYITRSHERLGYGFIEDSKGMIFLVTH